jgi:hypothetical protein
MDTKTLEEMLVKKYKDCKRVVRKYAKIGMTIAEGCYCPSCWVKGHEIFMVKDEVWLEAGLPLGTREAGYWCFDCFEKKLGRQITIDDLETNNWCGEPMDILCNHWLRRYLIERNQNVLCR